MKVILIGLFVIWSSNALADDLLLDTLQGKAPAPAEGQIRASMMAIDLTKLSDPFQKHLYAQFEMSEQVPHDVLQWANLILQGNYAGASHLWSVIEPQVPEKLSKISNAAYLYSLWKLDLHQTFFNKWLKMSANKEYTASNAAGYLDGVVAPSFDQWLIDNSIVLNKAQEEAINSLDDKSVLAMPLKSWVALRKGEKAETLLDRVNATSPLRYQLAETVALAHARRGDLVGVARILKNHLQPIIEKMHDPKILTHYYLSIGRLLYQAGNLKAAKEYYEKVPATSSEYLQAREELAWVLLRQGDIPQLRGEMKTLSTPLFDEIFAPDVYIVRAISNLKMCYYDSVEKDFDKFTKNNRAWAKTIDQAMSSSVAQAPRQLDFFSQYSVNALQKLNGEKARLEQFGKESIAAALPAVGVQKHWKEAQDDVQALLEIAKKNQDQEFRRQWKNQSSILSEAIRKMRFVKIEYLTEIRQLSEGKLDKSSLVADQGNVIPASALKKNKDEIVFPLDLEPWPDELFRLRSAAQGRCLKSQGAK